MQVTDRGGTGVVIGQFWYFQERLDSLMFTYLWPAPSIVLFGE